jgi:hypothetical protein
MEFVAPIAALLALVVIGFVMYRVLEAALEFWKARRRR